MNFFHGVDIVEVNRIAKMLDSHGDKFINRCFSESEQSVSNVSSDATRTQRYAARYAAKEAVMKALGVGLAQGITWRDICVIRTEGSPQISLSGKANEIAKKLGILDWRLSLSHTGNMAIASVIGIGED